MKRSSFKQWVCGLSMVLLLSEQAFAKGQETGNGGTVIVDGETYTLSDLDFTAVPGQNFSLDDAIKAKIQSQLSVLSAHAISIDGAIFSPLTEYRFVGALPDHCVPILAQAQTVGCAQGSITYIIPKAYSQISLDQRAEVLIQIRVSAMEAAADVPNWTSAIRTVVEKFVAAENGVVQLTDDELSALNAVMQWEGGSQQFVQGGGTIRFKAGTHPQIEVKNSVIDIDSSISMTAQNGISPSDMKVQLQGVDLIQSTISASVISLQSSLLINSKLSGATLNVTDANIQESNLSFLTIQVDGLKTNSSTTYNLDISGSFFEIEPGQVYSTLPISGNHVRLCPGYYYQLSQTFTGDNKSYSCGATQ